MKKFIALLLSVLTVFSVIPFTAFAQVADEILPEEQNVIQANEELPIQTTSVEGQDATCGKCGDNLTWSYDTTTATLTISGTGDMYDYDWDDAPWYSYCKNIKSVVISNSVTSIGEDAFSYCTSLTSITIPDSVTSIGSYAFEYCYKLVEVIDKSSLGIEKGSDEHGCVAYYAKTVHKGDTKIDNVNDYLFYTDDDGTNYLLGYVGNDKGLVLPKNYKGESYAIYDYAFYELDSLKSVIIGNGVTSIGENVFKSWADYTLFYTGSKEDWNKIDGYDNVKEPVEYNYVVHEHIPVIDKGYAATCLVDGLTDGSHCSVCNMVLTSQETIPAIGHHTLGEWTTTKSATCVTKGSKEQRCTVCNNVINTEEIQATGEHSLGSWTVTKKATCTTSGTQVQKCTVCKVTLNTKTIKATGHKLGSWTVTKKATCTAKGTKAQKCTVCKKAINTKTIKATGHKLGSWTTTKKATCTQKGTQVQKCTTCKKVIKTKTVATVKHKLVYVAAKAATKTKKAVKAHYKCSVCKKEFADKSAKKVFKK